MGRADHRLNKLCKPPRRLVYNGVFGTNIDTIRVITTEVMQPRGLVGMGQDTLDLSGSQIAQVLLFLLSNPFLWTG